MEDRPSRHLRANRGKNPNARWIVEEPVKKKAAKRRKSSASKADRPAKKAAKPDAEEYTGETRCRCDGKVSDEKTMAECENCSTWQHIVCEYGVDDESALPEPYFCHDCRDPGEEAAEVKDDPKVENGSSEPKDTGANGAEEAEGADSDANDGWLRGIENKVRRSVAEAWLSMLEKISAENKEVKKEDLSQKDLEDKAIELEKALYDAFSPDSGKDVTQGYREAFRMLSFNLKDDKNKKLQQSVLSGSLPAGKFVKMSSEDLRNPELQQIAEDIHKESIRESIIKEEQPPTEVISMATAEVNAEPSDQILEKEEQQNELNLEDAMKEPMGPTPVSALVAEVTQTPVEEPIWKGKVSLEDHSIEFSASGLYLPSKLPAAVGRTELKSYISDELTIQGLVQLDKAAEYFKASAAESQFHRLGSCVVVASQDQTAKSEELFDFMKKLNRLGSIKTTKPNVKDAFLIPWDHEFDLSFLELDADAQTFLSHLKTEHDDRKMLIALYVVNTQ